MPDINGIQGLDAELSAIMERAQQARMDREQPPEPSPSQSPSHVSDEPDIFYQLADPDLSASVDVDVDVDANANVDADADADAAPDIRPTVHGVVDPRTHRQPDTINYIPKNTPHEIQKLKPRHHEIMRRLLCGHSQAQIAQDLKMSPQTISMICKSALFKKELTRLQRELENNIVNKLSDVGMQLRALQPQAVNVLAQLMNNKTGSVPATVRRAAAKDVLELASKQKVADEFKENMSDFAFLIKAGYELAVKTRQMPASVSASVPASVPGNTESTENIINITPST